MISMTIEFLSPLRSRLGELVATLLVADQEDGLGVTCQKGIWILVSTPDRKEIGGLSSRRRRMFSGQPCSLVSTMTSSVLKSSSMRLSVVHLHHTSCSRSRKEWPRVVLQTGMVIQNRPNNDDDKADSVSCHCLVQKSYHLFG
ncbi:hypothetical protein ASPCAL11220 [Aspergillus calidoustus]|uniref:Uncharacterized protein n=1 Tax=Aspergillus calidoustus TaxID=454130 RepID=A0A0U5G8X0_ASPCI|nr:hypothetical protein ASPCAL11220 [Aspergillus calidoustus]